MALLKNMVTTTGFDCKSAYHKVGNIRIYNKTIMSFPVHISKDAGMPEFENRGYECAYDLNGQNAIKQAYEYLKTLPEFEGAQDC